MVIGHKREGGEHEKDITCALNVPPLSPREAALRRGKDPFPSREADYQSKGSIELEQDRCTSLKIESLKRNFSQRVTITTKV